MNYTVKPIKWINRKNSRGQKIPWPYLESAHPYEYMIFEEDGGCILSDGNLEDIYVGKTIEACKKYAEKHKMKALKRFLEPARKTIPSYLL